MTKSYSCVFLFLFLSFLAAHFGVRATPFLGGKTLKIGIPIKKDFKEFVDVKLNDTNQAIQDKVKGYSIDVFFAAVSYLEGKYSGLKVSYEFEAFVNPEGTFNGTYEELLQRIPAGEYDAVVGDVTIVESRSTYVDFTLPYAESSVRMLIQVRHNRHLDMWIFLRPFSWDLWLSIILFCVFIGFTLLFMERNANKDTRTEETLGEKKFTGPSILWLPIAQAVMPESESVAKKCSRFVLLVWLALAFIVVQSYTANLSSILTLDQMKPSYPTIDSLIRDKENVGYRHGSFIENLLIDGLRFDKLRLKNFSKMEDYREALRKGTRNGGIAAMFDELPYIKVFLKRYGSKYMMAGQTYPNSGFGFAFPLGSNLTSNFSRAILHLIESLEMYKIEKKYFGVNHDDLQDQYDQISSETSSLTTQSFGGLFIITGSLIISALLVSESYIWQRPVMVAKTFSKKYLFSSSRKVNPSMDGSTNERDAGSTNEENNHPESLPRSPSLSVAV
ncbi:hypothetical protein L6164_002680 [Bauhinia variegata]|uniref:Uncharacterized protein n=1 Tax=Bauhinia variegata TaxID=167791 RepID=A0ACB9PYY1_BAUVA|nr:hypothetical protein L6164_002680 [Bauhinia variegata]